MGSNPTTSLEVVNKKKYYSWILYDWANSAYATVVLAGFFPIIFADYYATEFLETTRILLLGIANSTASLLLIVFAPFLGLMADRKNNRKLFLIIFGSSRGGDIKPNGIALGLAPAQLDPQNHSFS